MGELRRRCKTCGENYAEGVIFCPTDGTALSLRAHTDAPDPYLGKTVAEQFRIDALIGEGAVGSVYRAEQIGVERTVAVKIMHRELANNEALLGRFRREARVAGSLDHPNLVNVLTTGVVEPGGAPFIAFEFLDGLSLRSALAAQGALSSTRAFHVVLQIAAAAAAAHERGIVHRDLKPENVMLVRRGEDTDFVKVLDFGVARVERGDVALATRAGAIFGSARYVSPESAAGAEATPASDVYALATIHYECLTGAPPFDGENAVQILLKHRTAAVPPLREHARTTAVPAELANFIERNLAKDPAQRAQNAREFARELANLAGALGIDAKTELTSRTHRGYAVIPAPEAAPRANDDAEILTPLGAPSSRRAGSIPAHGATSRALFVLVCFALGAGAALGIAAKLGAFEASGRPPQPIGAP